MLRHDLLDNGWHFEKKEPKKILINLIWLFFAAILTVPAASVFMAVIKADPDPVEFHIVAVNIIFISAPLIYFLIKAVLTIFFCSDENKKIHVKLTANSGMPVWTCREALKIRQIILMYLPPVVLIYPILIILGIISGGELYLLILIFLMSFFMSYDLTLIICALFLKLIYKPDYIAIDDHVYILTLYHQNYIERKKLINLKLPKIRFDFNKKILLMPLIFVAMLPAAYFALSYISNLKISENNNPGGAVIKGFTGSLFAGPDITVDGAYESGVSLAGNNIIFGSDFNLAVYYDNAKDSLMYLFDPTGEIRKLCIYENCRKNRSAQCGHVPNFLNGGAYSLGYLYGAINLHGVQNSYIVRYDVVQNTIEKFIEFDIYGESAYIQNMIIHGRYLYAVISIGDTAYLNVVRIDLENEDAVVLYSDDKEKAAGILRIHENYIIIFASGYIYKSDLDMRNFETLTSSGNISQLDIHAGHIYYCDAENKKLYRHNIKSNETEMLLDGVIEFCIDGDFIYYALDNVIYRAKLDAEHIDFYNKAAIYKPDQGYYLREWNVKNEYIYTLLFYDGYDILSRVYINASFDPYIFWKNP